MASDEDALMLLYENLKGFQWSNNLNWESIERLSKWYGVQTHIGHVVAIDLADNNLDGELPNSIRMKRLGSLERLYLPNNKLCGMVILLYT